MTILDAVHTEISLDDKELKATNANIQLVYNITETKIMMVNISPQITIKPCENTSLKLSISEIALVTNMPTGVLSK